MFLGNICGDFAVVHMDNQTPLPDVCIIINWRAQQYCKIICPIPMGINFRTKLIPGHFIITWTSGMTQELRVIALASLSGPWAPVVEQDTPNHVLLPNIPHIALHTVKPEGAKINIRRGGTLAVHENPLQSGTYRVWLLLQYDVARLRGNYIPRALLCSFCLSLPGPGGHRLTWQQRSCAAVASSPRNSGITYSGHTRAHLWGSEPHRIFPPDVHSAPISLKIIPNTPCLAGLVPYSGAVGYTVPGHTFVLDYF
ncbi:hypothetical protein C8R44DRAFT_786439, partial [Mycena epipterygia]